MKIITWCRNEITIQCLMDIDKGQFIKMVGLINIIAELEGKMGYKAHMQDYNHDDAFMLKFINIENISHGELKNLLDKLFDEEESENS